MSRKRYSATKYKRPKRVILPAGPVTVYRADGTSETITEKHVSAKSAEYKAYIDSEAWKAKRFEYRRAHPWQCFNCKTTRYLHLHHKTYERFGYEDLADLVPLCQACHTRAHKLIDAGLARLANAHLSLRVNTTNDGSTLVAIPSPYPKGRLKAKTRPAMPASQLPRKPKRDKGAERASSPSETVESLPKATRPQKDKPSPFSQAYREKQKRHEMQSKQIRNRAKGFNRRKD